jgi:DNA-binding NtrC family response regulator
MRKLARHYNLPPRELSPEVLKASQNYSWPGNMRELENFAKRYLVAGDEDLSSLGAEVNRSNGDVRVLHAAGTPKPQPKDAAPANISLKSLLQDLKSEAEQNAIAAALQKTGWNRKAASRLLNVSYRTMLYKIEQYHMSAAKAYSRSLENGSTLRGNENGHGMKRNGNAAFRDGQPRVGSI